MYKQDIPSLSSFIYNDVEFSQNNLNIFAGLCAVDNKNSVEAIMRELKANNLNCTRMGAYKPRTSPSSFQGHGKECLPYVFELAGKYGIKVIAMEITSDKHISEIDNALKLTGNPCGVMLQIGTRNTQNFELLKSVGKQNKHPVLIKRGFGITLDESLSATDYVIDNGNKKVIFCLRGVKCIGQSPHRNLVDFAQIPVVKRVSNMPVCIDPSHSVGTIDMGIDGLNDVYQATAQGIISGANMILVDFHSKPKEALVDAAQSLHISELEKYLKDIDIVRSAYLDRIK